MQVLSPLPETWELKILETRFFVLEQLVFAIILLHNNITLLTEEAVNLEAMI